MKKTFSISKLFIAVSFLGIVSFTSIFPSCSTANLSDVKLCTSPSGNECGSDLSTFQADVPVIYCTANLNNAPSDTKVTFDWKHEGVSIGKADVSSGSASVQSTMKPPAPLEPGKYSVTVKIEVDNSTPITKDFTIE